MEYLYSFEFSKGKIYEVKYTDLPKTAPKNERFKWFIELDDKQSLLDFVKMTSTTREFKLNDKCVYLDMQELYLKVDDEFYYL